MSYEAIALWSQVVAAVAFAAIVVWGFHKYLTPAINAATAAKNEEIRGMERRREDARKAVVLARAEVEQAENDAARIRTRIAHDADLEAANLVAEATREAERIVRNAEGELDRARLVARDKLRVDMIEKALNAARREAQSRIDERVNHELVRHFIDELERGERA